MVRFVLSQWVLVDVSSLSSLLLFFIIYRLAVGDTLFCTVPPFFRGSCFASTSDCLRVEQPPYSQVFAIKQRKFIPTRSEYLLQTHYSTHKGEKRGTRGVALRNVECH